MTNFVLVNGYSFFAISELESYRYRILEFMAHHESYGLCMVSSEGCNLAICSPARYQAKLKRFVENLLPNLNTCFFSESDTQTFRKQLVKIKPEIVKMGLPCDSLCAGKYLSPEEWHEMMQLKDVLVVDARNENEYRMGYFQGSVQLNLQVFSEFRAKWDKMFTHLPKHTKIMMACTGGVRCEKTTHYLLTKGYTAVYHLQGGMLSYLKRYGNTKNNLFKGDLYVFDARMSIDHNLQLSQNYLKCYVCGNPVPVIEINQHKEICKRYLSSIALCYNTL